MAAPTPPPRGQTFTKKTWGTEVITSFDLNRIEEAINDLHSDNTQFTGDKRFPDYVTLEGDAYIGDGSVYKGKMTIDVDDFMFESLDSVTDVFEFWDVVGAALNEIEVAQINNVVIEAHALRHGLNSTDFFSKTATIVVDASGTGDYTTLENAITKVVSSYPAGAEIMMLQGSYTLTGQLNFPQFVTVRGIGDVTISGGKINLFPNCNLINLKTDDTEVVVNSYCKAIGCTFKDAPSFVVFGTSPLVFDCKIDNSIVDVSGIYITTSGKRCMLIGNKVYTNGNGIRIQVPSGSTLDGTGHIVKGNYIESADRGIFMDIISGIKNTGTVINGNTIVAGGLGIFCLNNIRYIMIMGNTLEAGGLIAAGAGNIIENNTQ